MCIRDRIGATPGNLKPFADLGLDIIRMDGNFGTQGDIQLTRNPYNIKIEFNASMDTVSYTHLLLFFFIHSHRHHSISSFKLQYFYF